MSARTLPLFPLGTVLFPGGPLSLRIFEPRYIDMVGRCLRAQSGFGVVLVVDGGETGGGALATAAVGTEARIVDFNRLDDGLLGLTCLGQERLRIVRAWRQEDGLNLGDVEDLPADAAAEVPVDCAHLPEALRRLYPDLDASYAWVTPRWDDAGWVGNRLAELAPLEAGVKQGLLELGDPLERLRFLAPLIRIGSDQTDA
ncbi:MAG TPA: LON peptidase substrate-binding domain-containing protein [Steroidobacteraceae bacterium]|nr:LON peptidase substrate-binding domain-containing protein [Steroidobacteraceae bacterium]